MDNTDRTGSNQQQRNTHLTFANMLKWTVNKPNATSATTTTTSNNNNNNTMSIFIDNETSSAASVTTRALPAHRRSLGAALQPARSKPHLRKSLGSATAVATRKLLRSQNKENCIMVSPHAANLMRNSPTTSTQQQQKADSAFREIGNLTPTTGSASLTPLRKPYLPPSPSPKSHSGSRKTRPLPAQQRLFAATLPTLNVEYSPACNVLRPNAQSSPLPLHGITVQNSIFGPARYFGNDTAVQQKLLPAKQTKLAVRPSQAQTPEATPLAFQLSNLRFSQISLQQCGLEDDSNVSSKSLDDTALDRMIDEILESTRKPRKCPAAAVRSKQQVQPSQPCPVTTSTDTSMVVAAETPSSDSSSDDEPAERTIISVNGKLEREVRTPDSTSTAAAVAASVATPDELCGLRRQRVVRRKHTAKGKKSCAASTTTVTPELEQPVDVEMLAQLDTPKHEPEQPQMPLHQITIDCAAMQGSSTPTIPSAIVCPDQTRRCLRYPDSPDSMEDSREKRQSVASATGSTGSTTSSKSGTQLFGTLDVTVAVVAHQVHVHVLRCNDLIRTNGGAINAYVKVALLSSAAVATTQTSDAGFQRTAVHRNASAPVFEHRFVFERAAEQIEQRIQLSVWHRDREYKRSEFLGCMSFPIQSLLTSAAAGTFRLQSQSNLLHPTLPVLLDAASPTSAAPASRNLQSAADRDSAAAYLHQSTTAAAANGAAAISLSKKALYQREADELLYLRYLQLHPQQNNGTGRTDSTLSKRMHADASTGFGFTVVWTHPPRVDRVEAGRPAAAADVRPGDFLCFVGEHNVVTMPEVDVLNLIRAQGAQLELEVFRKDEAVKTMKRPAEEFELTAATTATVGDFGTRPKLARVEFCAEVGSGIIV